MATVSHLRPADFPVSRLPAVNVSQVPQRSPLGCPGGKTWLIPHIREWLQQVQSALLVEPFAGGGIVSLTAVMEDLVERCIMIELDAHVAAFWQAVLQEGEALAQCIEQFKPTVESVAALAQTTPTGVLDRPFLMTYDSAPGSCGLVRRHGFHAVHVAMHNAHHDTLPNLVITPEPMFA